MPTINKIFIEIPTWLGDAVMTTPAIENIIKEYPYAKIIMLGSYVSTQALGKMKNISKVIVDNSKKEGNRYLNLMKIAKEVGSVDLAISFRKSFSSKFMMFFIKAKQKYSYQRFVKEEIHQAIRYNDFINRRLNLNYDTGDLKLYFDAFKYEKPTLGINPGATYGSAKRWYPEEFAKVAIEMSKKYNIVIFGGPEEVDIASEIKEKLISKNITNVKNLAGKTSIPELIEKIAGLDLFITNDSGPMHVAASFKIPTIAIFGPTKYTETNQWKNPNGIIVSKDLECAPCMKRVCPLGHHDCMKMIRAEDILQKIEFVK
ncbi:MAG: lipopolysaccharide heptosyltransferase II [Arcobacter sp.]|nr:MAG: lipopolysaccharide heptosyltransferase II [Arcobacter sp.]